LSLWFRGYPASTGNFVEVPVGTYTMTGSGTDITGSTDEFHFAYKMLTGAGSIVARVDSIENTNEWVIPLQAFADQGINLTNVDRIVIGLGTWGNTTIPGGSGKMYFDDIRLYRPEPEPEPEP